MGDYPNGRLPPWKTTLMEDNLNFLLSLAQLSPSLFIFVIMKPLFYINYSWLHGWLRQKKEGKRWFFTTGHSSWIARSKCKRCHWLSKYSGYKLMGLMLVTMYVATTGITPYCMLYSGIFCKSFMTIRQTFFYPMHWWGRGLIHFFMYSFSLGLYLPVTCGHLNHIKKSNKIVHDNLFFRTLQFVWHHTNL